MTLEGVDAHALRRLILDQAFRAGAGHIGSALSIADVLAVLFGSVAPTLGTDDRDRDQLVLSKGHAALALYCVLHQRKIIDENTLGSFCCDGTFLGVHAEFQVAGVDFSSGSLGQGLGIGAGRAWATRLRASTARTYVLLSDAELNEGSVWEAIMFSGHHKLDNLTAIVDLNGQQALARTRDVIDLGSVSEKFVAFGWSAVECDGHDKDQLEDALRHHEDGKPVVVVARTISGYGVPFMESAIEWHYRSQSSEQYQQAVESLRT